MTRAGDNLISERPCDVIHSPQYVAIYQSDTAGPTASNSEDSLSGAVPPPTTIAADDRELPVEAGVPAAYVNFAWGVWVVATSLLTVVALDSASFALYAC